MFFHEKGGQFSLFPFRWLPESARWLLANGRTEKAKKYLVECALMNKRNPCTTKLDTEVQIVVYVVDETSYSFCEAND